MKKITLLISFIACVIFAQAQNLLVNPSFETWTAGLPDGWTVPANIAHAGSFTASQETTIFSDGTSALKLEIGTTQNPGFQQIVPITAGKTYTVKVDYYVVSGDLTDARIWSSFKIGDTFFATANWTAAVAADPTIQLKLQGSGSDMAAYFSIANGTWGTYTTDFVAPANTTSFIFECRSYKGAVVIWDNASVSEKTVINGLSTTNSNLLDVKLVGKRLTITNASTPTVEIFNTVGAKIQSIELVDGSANLNLTKGLYIVRSGNQSSKIML